MAALAIIEGRKDAMDFTDVVYYQEFSVVLYKKPNSDENFVTVFFKGNYLIYSNMYVQSDSAYFTSCTKINYHDVCVHIHALYSHLYWRFG